MFGPPKDVDGQCNAHLQIGDDYGDNHATMRCQLEPGHAGKHREKYMSRGAGEVVIEWEKDERSHRVLPPLIRATEDTEDA